ncbi:hypothetical protein K2173_018103 [Erythroxylum novogranatense]|uniref:Uncharacterized protein n=1 Tax=Erythroxylum novogranatense TaxID=1862640 RepID=A0AAV8U9L5_9ROSI|nr:hypothetical protein K2173_018103 [Erythroxylum novogranatense]
MAKLLVSNKARKEFTTLCRTFDEVKSQLQTKFRLEVLKTKKMLALFKNSIKFVKEVALEDETKLKGIPPEDSSKILLWFLEFPIEKLSTHDL